MFDHAVPSAIERNIDTCLLALPEGASISYVGVMTSRPDHSVRLNVAGLGAEGVPAYLDRIGWPGPKADLASVLSGVADSVNNVVVGVDAGDTSSDRVGLECFPGGQPDSNPAWHRLFDHLVDIGLCSPDKRAALDGWPGRGETLLRRLSHVKITLRSSCPPAAKAYLWFGEPWDNWYPSLEGIHA